MTHYAVLTTDEAAEAAGASALLNACRPGKDGKKFVRLEIHDDGQSRVCWKAIVSWAGNEAEPVFLALGKAVAFFRGVNEVCRRRGAKGLPRVPEPRLDDNGRKYCIEA